MADYDTDFYPRLPMHRLEQFDATILNTAYKDPRAPSEFNPAHDKGRREGARVIAEASASEEFGSFEDDCELWKLVLKPTQRKDNVQAGLNQEHATSQLESIHDGAIGDSSADTRREESVFRKLGDDLAKLKGANAAAIPELDQTHQTAITKSTEALLGVRGTTPTLKAGHPSELEDTTSAYAKLIKEHADMLAKEREARVKTQKDCDEKVRDEKEFYRELHGDMERLRVESAKEIKEARSNGLTAERARINELKEERESYRELKRAFDELKTTSQATLREHRKLKEELILEKALHQDQIEALEYGHRASEKELWDKLEVGGKVLEQMQALTQTWVELHDRKHL